MKLEIDWPKLAIYNDVISHRIEKKLPSDWNLTFEEIKSEVNETFIKLIKLFVPKVDGMSLTSYCYKFAEQYTLQRLLQEYSRLKKQVSYEQHFSKKYEKDDYQFKHQYGYYDIEPYVTIDKQLEKSNIIDNLLSISCQLDRQIMKYILQKDMTFDQISKKLKISKASVSNRLKKYAKLLI